MSKKKNIPVSKISIFKNRLREVNFFNWLLNNKLQAGLLLAVIALYFILVAQYILSFNIWFDEGFTAFLIRHKFSEVIYYSGIDVHPPFYYILLKIWANIFGYSLIAERYMSVTIGAVSIIIFYILLRKIMGGKAIGVKVLSKKSGSEKISYWMPLIGCVLLASNPFFFHYCLEARMYALFVLLALLSTFYIIKIIDKDGPVNWIIYTLLAAAGVYTQYYFALVILCHIIWYFVCKKKSGLTIKPLLAFVAGALMYIPWYKYFWKTFSESLRGTSWIKTIMAWDIPSFWTEIWTYFSVDYVHNTTTYPAPIWVVIGVGFSLAILILAFFKLSKRYLVLFLLLAILPPVILCLARTFVSRYCIFSAIAMIILLVYYKPVKNSASNVDKVGHVNRSNILTIISCVLIGAVFVVQFSIGLGNMFKTNNDPASTNEYLNATDLMKQIKYEKGRSCQDDSVKYVLVEGNSQFLKLAAYESPNFHVYYAPYNGAAEWSSYQMLADNTLTNDPLGLGTWEISSDELKKEWINRSKSMGNHPDYIVIAHDEDGKDTDAYEMQYVLNNVDNPECTGGNTVDSQVEDKETE
ncbi:MAG: glycosyltransferase family 39 protein [Candidatus Ancillula sp.]|nr:glycosyltransferase family 39 protein [Candidatus Ancillula sp.]